MVLGAFCSYCDFFGCKRSLTMIPSSLRMCGGVQCTVYFLGARKKRAKSNDGFVRALTKMSAAQLSSVFASALWPLKTAAQLASIAGKDERTAARWLSGESDPPGILIAAIINEITRARLIGARKSLRVLLRLLRPASPFCIPTRTPPCPHSRIRF
jgi:hypothetical protein